MSKTKIILCTPSYNGLITNELLPFILEAGQSKYEIIPLPISHKATDAARNIAVMEGQRKKAHVVFVDADAIPAAGSFTALADKVSEEVCAACCPYVSAHGAICVGETTITPKEVREKDKWELVESFGTHCCAFNYNVFAFLSMPYFHYEYDATGRHLLNGAEDTTCCRKLSKAGVPMYVHWGLWAGHLITSVKGKPKPIDKETLNLMLCAYAD
jgi:hypothetical protein